MKGKIVVIIGFVVDVFFMDEFLNINDVFEVRLSEIEIRILEVVFYLGNYMVCIILFEVIDGLVCGMEVIGILFLIKVLVGKKVLGCMLNVLGKLMDGLDEVDIKRYMLIYKLFFDFYDLGGEIEILEIGIKVIDLIVLYIKGGKIGLFGGVGVGKIVLI